MLRSDTLNRNRKIKLSWEWESPNTYKYDNMHKKAIPNNLRASIWATNNYQPTALPYQQLVRSDQLKKLREEHLKIQLTISLHAATQSARNRIIPHMRIYAIEDVVKQALSYSERHNRKIVFAYLLLPGINDRPSDVRQLAKWFRGKKVMINVLQYNPTSNSRIKAPQKREIVAFKHQLEQAGLEVTMRVSHGREINAACGQLANTYNKFKKK